MSALRTVWLATCTDFPAGEPGGDRLPPAFAALGVDARWVSWDDPVVDWSIPDLVLLRSPWDYDTRLPEFLTWARARGDRLLHDADVIAWNTDKAYLLALAGAGVPIVPSTVSADPAGLARSDVDRVFKPTVAAGGRGLVVVPAGSPVPAPDPAEGPWLVQPLVASVRTEGEHSVFVLGGEPVAQVLKVPAAGGEVRVHQHLGGTTTPVPSTPEAADLARRTVRAAETLLGTALVYARVDLLRLDDGSLAVSELEVTEPGLYLDVLPGNADAFAAAVTRWFSA